jgi:signal transduction histidine kinase
MENSISEIIQSCEWYGSQFLIISENVFSPLLYYSYFGSLIPSVLIALFVFLSGPKKISNKLLLMMILSFSGWIFFNLVTWATELPSMTMFAWSFLIILEPLVYFFALYFVYTMIFEKDFSFGQKLLFASPLLVTFLLTPTKFGLLGYDLSNCDRAAIEGIVATYGYAIEFVYILLIMGFFGYFLMITKDAVLRKKAALITTGIVLFLLSFSAGNILEVFTENWLIGQYGLFGAPIFVGFLAYSMVKYKTFNTKILGTQVLVVGLWVAVLSMLFVRNIENVRYVVLGTLLLVTIFGYQLIRSVLQIEQQKVSLQKANEQQQSLMRFINHQVKGFFTRSRIIFDSLKNGEYGKLPPEAAELVQVGFDTNTEGVQMVKSLLDAANLHDGTVQYKKVRLDFRALVSDIAGQVREMATGKGLTFDVVATDPAFIFGDLTHLAQAVRNLIENAIQYTEKGVVSVTLRVQSGNAVLAVSDSGLGLTPEDRARLFKQGGRGEEATRRNVNSTGYGLYITKQIVKAHNGTIEVASAGRDKGSTFTISIPLASE